MTQPIYVTRPFLPPLAELIPSLERIWENQILTNGGPYHQAFEAALAERLGVPHLSLFTNATVALLVAMKALDLQGEVITTPYSFVATSHALLWAGLEPVFVDVDPRTLNLDPRRIEAAITPRTSAILPVHCYGHPCDTAAIGAIAERRGLRVIYDAAHAFAVEDAGGSVLRHGDLSVLSFHATKVFNTFEGGAIVCPDAETKRRVDHLKNFGIVDETHVEGLGLNGKMSEFNAALGLVQLKHLPEVLEARARIDAAYRERLAGLSGIRCLASSGEHRGNHAYFPILVEPPFPATRDQVHARLKAEGILARRYFFPLISDFPLYRERPSAAPDRLPVAAAAAEAVLCLPIYPGLEMAVLDRIAACLRSL